MATSENGSLAAWLDAWRAGDASAAGKIYHYYEERVRGLADRMMSPRLKRRVAPDDILLSVLNSILSGVAEGRYSADATGSLWNLVARISKTKVLKHLERHTADRRDIRRELDVQPADLPPESAPAACSPEVAAILADQFEQIRARLKPLDFEIFQLWLAEHSYSEIAACLGKSKRNIQDRMNRIREVLAGGSQVAGDFLHRDGPISG